MAIYYSDLQTIINGPAYGQPLATRTKANRSGGRIRYFEAMYTVGAGTLLVADKIVWGKLPLKAKIINHLCKMIWTVGQAAATLNLGDNVVAARHLAATSVTSAGSAVPTASEQVNTATADVTSGSNVIVAKTSFGSFQIGANITGTGIPASTTIVGISGPNVQLSAAATATNAGLTVTVNGGGYEVTDDSNSVSNGFASTTDDATLVSTVAGAALVAGQVVTLKIAYVQD